jgi:3-deoxy-manno-octulosonate cytidylyltransferase (CMP-KDO synthetase)
MNVVAIIPARFGSTRLPGKPLAQIGGRPMIQHVYQSALKAKILDRVIVATDDRRIESVVKEFGGEVMMTSPNHASGTDRLAEVARKIKADLLVNLQGDLPFISAKTIRQAVDPLRHNRNIPLGTVCTAIYDEQEWRNPNVVKVLTDKTGLALIFTRAAVPFGRNDAVDPSGNKVAGRIKRRLWGYRHLGLYVFRREFLFKFARMRPTALERIESLEQLRALENGYRIYVAQVDEQPVEVDTPADLLRAENYLHRRSN